MSGAVRARLASANPHKLHELEAALPGWQLSLLDAGPFPPEDGSSYYENAAGKARFGRSVDSESDWVLGEDSGIEVDGLGGRPGIESARWAGSADPVEALLAALAGTSATGRGARYVCELVALSPDGRELRATGMLAGRIADRPAGAEGFGYDPVFIPAGETRTVAELGNAWKARSSHRARAAAALRRALEPVAGS